MSCLALALIPVLLVSTGIGANTGSPSSPTARQWVCPSRDGV
jgi:hypothetical protein